MRVTKTGDQLETSREVQVPEEAGSAGYFLVLGSDQAEEKRSARSSFCPCSFRSQWVSGSHLEGRNWLRSSYPREKEILMGLSVFQEMAIAKKSRSSW